MRHCVYTVTHLIKFSQRECILDTELGKARGQGKYREISEQSFLYSHYQYCKEYIKDSQMTKTERGNFVEFLLSAFRCCLI